MSTLGIGTRVWVGWCPDDNVAPDGDARLRTGIISDGPFRDSLTYWEVLVAGDPEPFDIDEFLLTPIDDGDQTVETPQEEAVPA